MSFLRASVAQSISFSRTSGLPAVTEPFGFHPWDLTPAKLHPSVKSYLWSADQTSLIQVEQDIPKLAGSAIVLDWHQVLGTDRSSSRNTQ